MTYQQHRPPFSGSPQTSAAGPVKRPGMATAAAVLGFIQAGTTLAVTVMLAVSMLERTRNPNLGELWALFAVQFVGAILLIFGCVQLIKGKSRMLFMIAAGLQIGFSLYWLIRFGSADALGGGSFKQAQESIVVTAIGFAANPVIGLCLAAPSGVGKFIAAKRAR